MINTLKILISTLQELWTGKRREGFSVIGVVVGSAVLTIYIGLLAGGIVYFNSASAEFSNKNKALLWAREGLEATRNVKAGNFSDLTDGSYGLEIQSNQWELGSAPEDLGDGFERVLTVSSPEEGVKQVESTVTWEWKGEGKEISLISKFTNWKEPTNSSGGGGDSGSSCKDVCTSAGYNNGLCRQGSCKGKEVHESDGDSYCSAPKNTCCCK